MDRWTKEFTGRKQLRPIHYAIFTDSFDCQGRMYTGKYGHQALMKEERAKIKFGAEPAVEWDFSGLFPRMLYHIEGEDYRKDPYAIWAEETTPCRRMLAKLLINALINAKTPQGAISACNKAMCHKTKEGKWKQGKSLRESRDLYDAWKSAKIKFSEMVPLIEQYHPKIRKYFSSDRGVHLMRIEAKIALDIMTHFAENAVPCLCCHDSFIVPFGASDSLFKAMNSFYQDEFSFLPVIKEG
jgi:hypothetical protein